MFFQTELKTVSVVKRIKLLNISKYRSQSINTFFFSPDEVYNVKVKESIWENYLC